MKTTNKPSTKQLEKYTAVFMQLGLVLSLFIVFLLLEHQIEKTTIGVIPLEIDNSSMYFLEETPKVFVKQPSKPKKIKLKIIKPTILDKIVKGDSHQKIETIIEIPDTEDNNAMIETALKMIEEDPDTDGDLIEEDTHLFVSLEEAPIFKGCENLSKIENKKCFETKIREFVQKNFNAGIAQEIGLEEGNYTIFTEFVINKKGTIIDVKIRAPHKRLRKETIRVIKKMPQFIPGKQRNKAVKVKYILPISFRVE